MGTRGIAFASAALAACLSLAPPYAWSANVYLECVATYDEGSKRFSVALDESTRKVTHTYVDTGSAFNAEGFFSAQTITYQSVSISGGIENVFKYSIDRSTLQVTEEFSATPTDPRIASKLPGVFFSGSGLCEIIDTSDRKI